MTCENCKKDVIRLKFENSKWVCRDCGRTETFCPIYHVWEDGKGSYGTGWLNDVKRRKVVSGGEVIRDVGRKYFA
jgi:hypothetical protein